MIAPYLADEINVEGELSLELTRLRLPLNRNRCPQGNLGFEVEGVVSLRDVSAEINNSVTRRLVMVATELMELGEFPERLQVVDQTRVKFDFREGRLHHESLTIALPELSPDFVLRTGGSVGVDESVKLQVAIQVPLTLLDNTPLARKISRTPIRLRVTGTLDEPKLGLPVDQVWVSDLSQHLLSETLSFEEMKLAENVLAMIGSLLEEADGEPANIPPDLLKRIRTPRGNTPLGGNR